MLKQALLDLAHHGFVFVQDLKFAKLIQDAYPEKTKIEKVASTSMWSVRETV